tara:strand:+ start:2666 stop:3550 length:885 start_codon:yes stop_codon:yes gene_type:complete
MSDNTENSCCSDSQTKCEESRAPQTALTSPSDKDTENKYEPDRTTPSLSNEETVEAMKELSVTDYVEKYPKTERAFADPSIPGQTYQLVSFVPSSGATPDDDGVYGMIKCRGAYQTQEEANDRAEFLIRNVDSYHKIFTAWVGKPFPATNDSKYSADTNAVDVRKKATEVISKDIREKKREEQKEIEEIKEREKKLVEESKQDERDPFEFYIECRVKKAQLTWTYLETLKKMEEMKESILKVREQIKEADAENADYIKQYREKYMEARKEAGIPDNDDSFIKYLGEDRDSELGF